MKVTAITTNAGSQEFPNVLKLVVVGGGGGGASNGKSDGQFASGGGGGSGQIVILEPGPLIGAIPTIKIQATIGIGGKGNDDRNVRAKNGGNTTLLITDVHPAFPFLKGKSIVAVGGDPGNADYTSAYGGHYGYGGDGGNSAIFGGASLPNYLKLSHYSYGGGGAGRPKRLGISHAGTGWSSNSSARGTASPINSGYDSGTTDKGKIIGGNGGPKNNSNDRILQGALAINTEIGYLGGGGGAFGYPFADISSVNFGYSSVQTQFNGTNAANGCTFGAGGAGGGSYNFFKGGDGANGVVLVYHG